MAKKCIKSDKRCIDCPYKDIPSYCKLWEDYNFFEKVVNKIKKWFSRGK